MCLLKIQTQMEILFGRADFVKNKIKMNPFILFLPISSIAFRRMVTLPLIEASAKIIPPIILFLIDISGSMTSSIYTDLWTKSQK